MAEIARDQPIGFSSAEHKHIPIPWSNAHALTEKGTVRVDTLQ